MYCTCTPRNDQWMHHHNSQQNMSTITGGCSDINPLNQCINSTSCLALNNTASSTPHHHGQQQLHNTTIP